MPRPPSFGARLAAGSASLQADALDFLGDAINYGISLFVIGMTLRHRASAALVKAATKGVFGLWVIGTAVWHAVHGTLPSAFAMGVVGFTALVANAASFGLLRVHRYSDANMRYLNNWGFNPGSSMPRRGAGSNGDLTALCRTDVLGAILATAARSRHLSPKGNCVMTALNLFYWNG